MIDAVDTKNLNDPNVLQAEIEQIIDSVSNNPSWKLVLPNDFNIKLLEKYLYPLFPELAYLEIQHSINASNYELGVYEVPYNKYVDLVLGDITSEEI